MRHSAIDHFTFPKSPNPVDLLISSTARLQPNRGRTLFTCRMEVGGTHWGDTWERNTVKGLRSCTDIHAGMASWRTVLKLKSIPVPMHGCTQSKEHSTQHTATGARFWKQQPAPAAWYDQPVCRLFSGRTCHGTRCSKIGAILDLSMARGRILRMQLAFLTRKTRLLGMWKCCLEWSTMQFRWCSLLCSCLCSRYFHNVSKAPGIIWVQSLHFWTI